MALSPLPPPVEPFPVPRGGSLKQFLSTRSTLQSNFYLKSLSELSLALSLQLLAEFQIRSGLPGLLKGIDYVVAAVLTAMAGKYYSMLRTLQKSDNSSNEPLTWLSPLPFSTRLLLFLKTGRSLFLAGFIAGFSGYSLCKIFTYIRLYLGYNLFALKPVNILYASLYTGGFMALISNVRYTVLQVKVEPFIERYTSGGVMRILIFGVRCGNGFLGSWIAIWGMRFFGVQSK
ncbi:hypothetical protein TL16_g09064 [Triparma laevis f. inornata]|uniref:Uncharacterized protein n=1 Tax=Triparma laevis f. inornata TaxID=1714386 RepID=A0A9W7ELV2_9STRA|nr:hypothetical protein TL16_g09064 [Triparma laevis f. inornata]